MRQRFKVWNIWRKKSLNGRWYKLMVLFDLKYSPTFEFELAMRRVGRELSDFSIRAGNAIKEISEKLKEYSDNLGGLNGRDTESEATD